jgi:hypothetical protein
MRKPKIIKLRRRNKNMTHLARLRLRRDFLRILEDLKELEILEKQISDLKKSSQCLN